MLRVAVAVAQRAAHGQRLVDDALQRRALEGLAEGVGDAVAADDALDVHGLRHLDQGLVVAERQQGLAHAARHRRQAVDHRLGLGLEQVDLQLLLGLVDLEPRLLVRLQALALGLRGEVGQLLLLLLQLPGQLDLLQLVAQVGEDEGELALGRLDLDPVAELGRLGDELGLLPSDLLLLRLRHEVALQLLDLDAGEDHLALGGLQQLPDLVVQERGAEHLHVVHAHAVLGEQHAGPLGLAVGLGRIGLRRQAEDRVADERGVRAVEIRRVEGLGPALQHAARVVAQVLDVVLDGEPLVGIALEVDHVADVEPDLDVILALDLHVVGDAVVAGLEVDRLQETIGGLGLAGRELHDGQLLVVAQERRLAALHDARLAGLGDDLDGVADVDLDARSALVLVVQDDRVRGRLHRGAIDRPATDVLLPAGVAASHRELVAGRRVLHRLEARGRRPLHEPLGTAPRPQPAAGGPLVGLLGNGAAARAGVAQRPQLTEVLVVDLGLVVAGVPERDLLVAQHTPDERLLARVGQERPGALDHLDGAVGLVHDVAGLALGDGHGDVLDATVLANDVVLLPRVVDLGLAAADEQLLAGLDLLAGLVGVVRDDLDVDALVGLQLDGAELPRHLAVVVLALDEALGRLREHDLRAVLVALLAVLVDQDAVLQVLQAGGLADVDAAPDVGAGVDRDDADAGGRDEERDLGALDDEALARGELRGRERLREGLGRGAGLGLALGLGLVVALRGRLGLLLLAADGADDGLAPVLERLLLVVDEGLQVLVLVELVAAHDLRALARPERERRVARDLDLASGGQLLRRLGDLGLREHEVAGGAEDGVEDRRVPALGHHVHRLDGLLEALRRPEALGPLVVDDALLLGRRVDDGRAGVDPDLAGRRVLHADEAVRVEDEIPLLGVAHGFLFSLLPGT